MPDELQGWAHGTGWHESPEAVWNVAKEPRLFRPGNITDDKVLRNTWMKTLDGWCRIETDVLWQVANPQDRLPGWAERAVFVFTSEPFAPTRADALSVTLRPEARWECAGKQEELPLPTTQRMSTTTTPTAGR